MFHDVINSGKNYLANDQKKGSKVQNKLYYSNDEKIESIKP